MDYDLYGIIGIRLINPSEGDVRNISKLLLPFRSNLVREPDINIEFKKNWELGDIINIGLDTGFNDDGFYILSNGRTKLKAKIPFDKIGGKFTIVCEQDIVGIPLFNQFINLSFLRKNYVPIHASAFSYNNSNVLVIGWSKGGKSEILFSFMNHGAQFIGDETILISTLEKKIYGIPVPVSIWEWQFKEIPKLLPPLNRQKKMLFKGIHLINWLYKLANKIKLKNLSVVKLVGESLPVLKKQLNIRVAPDKIFGSKINWSEHNLSKIILAMSHSKKNVLVDECDSQNIINRMLTSSLYEFDSFYNFYNMYKFAFPGSKNKFIESVPEIYNELLRDALSDIETYKVVHPYPVTYESLFESLKPIVCENILSKSEGLI